MPRRDAISEKKKERLKLENDQLQKLMLEARSSVRRSSQKDNVDETVLPEESTASDVVVNTDNAITATEFFEERKPIHSIRQEAPVEKPVAIPDEMHTADSAVEKKPLTEKDIFPEDNNLEIPLRQPQKTGAVKVILPKEKLTETTGFPEERYTREVLTPEETGNASAAEPQERAKQTKPKTFVRPVQKNNNRKRSRPASYLFMVIAALLVGFGGYYLYYKTKNNTVTVAKKRPEVKPVPVSETPVTRPANSANNRNEDLKKNDPVQTADAEIKKEAPENVRAANTKVPASNPEIEKNTTSASGTTNGNADRYKVVSKAYFHNAPDASTRRKAFIIHWNNAVLTPIEEKNGFVYIVFTNHLGQTSKGWLRKKDLTQLN